MTSVENNTCWTGTTASTHGTNSIDTATATCTTVKTEAEIVPSETKTNIQIQGPHPKQKIDSVSSQSTSSTVNSDHAMIGSCTPNHCKIRYSRIFKKVSFDGNLVLFLPQRELGMSENKVESLMGVALIHENVMQANGMKVFLQVILNFRYGREDEELMGLRFCNEVVVAAEQIYPTAMEEAMDTKTRSKSGSSVPNVTENSVKTPKVPAVPNSTSLKRRNSALVNNQGFLAVPFVVDMGSAAPPSIRLIPCRPYSGAPIGTGYEVQLFASTSPDELPKRRKMVQMSLRLFEKIPKEIGPSPNVVVVKNYVLSDKPLTISAKLDKGNYTQGEEIQLTLKFHRKDKQPHGIRKVKVTLFQQVSVAMFSTGNFKNNIGEATHMTQPNPRDSEFEAMIPVTIKLGNDYSWAAMEDTPRKEASELTQLAPTVTHANKCLFIVRVTYYLQVVLVFGLLTKTLAMKLPFVLQRSKDSPRSMKDRDGQQSHETNTTSHNPEIHVKETFVQTPTHFTPSPCLNNKLQKTQSNEITR